MAAARNPRGPAGRHDRRPGAPRRSSRGATGTRDQSAHVQSAQSAIRRRHDSERSVPAAVNGAISALLGSAIGIAVLGSVALVSWVLAAGRSSVGAMLDFVGYTWLAGHLAPVQTEFGLVWAPPLVLTAACFGLAARVARLSVRRSGLGDGADLIRMVAAAGLVYGVIGLLVAAVTATTAAAVPEWAAFAGCAVVGAAGVWLGAAGAGGMLRSWTSRIPTYLRSDLRAGVRAMSLLLIAGGVLVIASLVLHGGAAAAALASLRAGITGTIVVLLLAVIYLPTVAIWAVGYSAAVPVSLGTDAAVAPWGDTGAAALPALPLFAAVPTAASWLLVLVLLPVAAGAYAAIVRDGPRPASAWRRLAGLARLAGGCALMALLAGLLAQISLAGRLSQMGPNPLLLSGAIGLLVFVGAYLGDIGARVRSRRQVAAASATTPDRGLVGVDS